MAHQIDESKPKYLSQTRFMSGRRIIKTSVTEITDENVVDVLRKALATHELNRSEIDYLWKYYRGDQPIRNRVKDVRPEICNKITENRANEIVSFKVGYLCGEPIQYVSRNGGEEIVKQINTLNEYMFAEDKAAQDQELVEWQMICGTAFRLVLPDEPGEEDEAPFELYTLDPRDTFVVYSNEIGNKPLMAVKYSKDDNEIFHYSIYTENRYYLVAGDILVESKPHARDMIPIIEYRETMLVSVLLRLCFLYWTQSTMWKVTVWTVWSSWYRLLLSSLTATLPRRNTRSSYSSAQSR